MFLVPHAIGVMLALAVAGLAWFVRGLVPPASRWRRVLLLVVLFPLGLVGAFYLAVIAENW